MGKQYVHNCKQIKYKVIYRVVCLPGLIKFVHQSSWRELNLEVELSSVLSSTQFKGFWCGFICSVRRPTLLETPDEATPWFFALEKLEAEARSCDSRPDVLRITSRWAKRDALNDLTGGRLENKGVNYQTRTLRITNSFSCARLALIKVTF